MNTSLKPCTPGHTESVRAVRDPQAGQESRSTRDLPVRVRETSGQEPQTSGQASEVRVREEPHRAQEEAEGCRGFLVACSLSDVRQLSGETPEERPGQGELLERPGARPVREEGGGGRPRSPTGQPRSPGQD